VTPSCSARVGDRFSAAALDPPPPPLSAHERLDQGLVRARLGVGSAAPVDSPHQRETSGEQVTVHLVGAGVNQLTDGASAAL
jgi:hypothetical protein